MTISFPMVCGEKKKKGNKKKREKQVATIGRLSTVEKKKNENLKKKGRKGNSVDCWHDFPPQLILKILVNEISVNEIFGIFQYRKIP